MKIPKPLTALITASLIGGLGNTILASYPEDPLLFASLRFLIAGIISLYWIKHVFTLPKLIQLASLLEVTAIITLILALSTVSVTLATVIGSLTPIVSLIINRYTHKQSTPKLIIIPITLGTLSTILIITQQPQAATNTALGVTLVIISVALSLTGSIINGYYGKNISPWTRTAYANLAGTIITIPILIANLANPQATHPDAQLIINAALAAILAGTIAKALHLYALQHISVPAVLQASTLSIITATITAALLLNQPVTLITAVGIIIGSLSIIMLAYLIQKEPKIKSS